MTRFSILMKWWLRHGVHSFVLRNLRGLGMASNFRRMKPRLYLCHQRSCESPLWRTAIQVAQRPLLAGRR